MALVIKDRVKESSTTTGTGSFTLAGAETGFRTFASIGDGNTTYYAAQMGDSWEVGLGTYTSSGSSLSRDTVLASSNSGNKVDWGAGTKIVFVTQPADKAVYTNASGGVANADTDDLTEGSSNLYFTNARVDAHLSGGTGVTYSSGTISIGQAVGTTSNVTFNRVTSTQDPTSATHLATKQYVDTVAAAGIHYHTPVRVESPDSAGNLNATYNNGSSGVGATLTNNGTQAALVMDGITLSVNDRVLIYNQTNAYENGVYTVTNVGSASTNWVLTRATDADSYGASDQDALGEGDAFFVKEGDTGAGELYVMNTSGTITFGTTAINFTVIAETAVYSAGNSLTLDGTVFDTIQDIRTTATPTFAGVTAPITGNVTGNLTGNVTGNVTGDVTGDITGDVTGNVTGNLTGNVTGNLTGNVTSSGTSNFSTIDFGNWTIVESSGSLYFAYDGTNKFKMTSDGTLQAVNDIFTDETIT